MNDKSPKMTYLAMGVAVIAASVVSGLWYSPLLFGKQWMALSGVASGGAGTAIRLWKPLVDIVREFVVVYVLARFVRGLGIVDWKGGLSLGFWVWLGFPAQMLVGASLWDNKPWMLDLIHAGDWFVKMLVESLILATWQGVRIARLRNVVSVAEQNNFSR